jgi:hypothetical protein
VGIGTFEGGVGRVTLSRSATLVVWRQGLRSAGAGLKRRGIVDTSFGSGVSLLRLEPVDRVE